MNCFSHALYKNEIITNNKSAYLCCLCWHAWLQQKGVVIRIHMVLLLEIRLVLMLLRVLALLLPHVCCAVLCQLRVLLQVLALVGVVVLVLQVVLKLWVVELMHA